MLFQSKLIQVIFLLLLFTFPIGAELAFCQALPPATTPAEENLAQLADSLRSEINKLRQEYSDLKIKMANKYLDWVSYVFAGVTFVAALFSIVFAAVSFFKYRALTAEYKEYLEKVTTFQDLARKSMQDIEKSRREFEAGLTKDKQGIDELKKEFENEHREKTAIFRDLANKSLQDINTLREGAAADLARSKQAVNDLKNKFELDIIKSKSVIDSLSKFFKSAMDTNIEIMIELMKDYIELLHLEVDAKKLGEVFDKIYQRKIYLYDLQGFVSDLGSEDKNERVRAIWGIEGMGTAENIKDLQKISDNKDEDPDIRVEAQRAVDNMKRRFGIQ